MTIEVNNNTESNQNKDVLNILEISKRERDSLKAQMYDADKRIKELDVIIAVSQRTLELLNKKE